MSRAHLPRATMRTIARLQQRESKAVGYRDQSLARLAYLIVMLAQDGKPDPAGRAVAQLRQAWGFKFECELERFAPEPEMPVELAAEVDERTGEQWSQSAMDYLVWRSGRNWRSGKARKGIVPDNLSEIEIYSEAIREVNLAIHRKHDAAKLIALSRAVCLAPQLVFNFAPSPLPFTPKKKAARATAAGSQRRTA